jgi:sialate O-acetylesterase
MRIGRALLALIAVLATAGGQARAELKVAAVFGDHMVLQQGVPVPVWGTANAGEKVTVRFAGQQAEASADAKGKWLVKLEALKAASGAEGAMLVVSGKKQMVTLKDVLVGEVWLCAGQSNMQWGLGGSDAADDIAAANFPAIRHSRGSGAWTVCSPRTAAGFTGVGFYFARKVHQETGLPIGLLNNSIGGTRIEPWLAPGSQDREPGLKSLLDAELAVYAKQVAAQLDGVEAWVKASRQALAEKKAPPPAPVLPQSPVLMYSSLYNPFTEPLRPYAIRGMLWYQGESNGGEGHSYFFKMKALIEGLRAAWGQGDFPVYFVQLPQIGGASDNPAGGDGWARIRQAQFRTLTIPQTGMAVTIDVGDPGDIHPRNKKDVGERLALWALAKDYGKKEVVYSGPLFRELKVEGDKGRVLFDHTGGGLMVGKKVGKKPVEEVKDGVLKRFSVAGADGKWAWAEARIDGDSVVVHSPMVPKPVAVRYAYQNNPAGANLYNRAGLPAGPFRSDAIKPAPQGKGKE